MGRRHAEIEDGLLNRGSGVRVPRRHHLFSSRSADARDLLRLMRDRPKLPQWPDLDGEREMEFSTASRRAFKPDSSAVHLGDLTRDLQPESGPGSCLAIDIGRHARSLVLNRHFDALGVGPARYRYLAARRRVLRRAAQQTREDLRHLSLVARDRRQRCIETEREDMAGALFASFLADPLDDLIDIYPTDLECGA